MSVVQQPLLTQEVQHEGPEAALAALLHRHQQIALLHQASNQIFIQGLGEASIRNLDKTTTSLRAENTCVSSWSHLDRHIEGLLLDGSSSFHGLHQSGSE